MPISVVFDPPLPSDSPSTFNNKAFTLLGDLNDWSTQANALPGEVATNLTTLLAAPPAIGSTTPAAVSATTLSAVGPITSTTTGTGVSGIKIYSTNVDAANRNWIIASNKDAYGDFHISQSNAAYGDAFSAGTSWLKISPSGAVTIPGSVGIGRAPTTKLDIFGVNQVVGIIQDPGSAGNSELKITSAGLSNYAALHFVSSGYIYDRTDSGNAICIGPDTVLANATAKFNTVSGVVEFTKGTFGYGVGAGGTVTQATSKSTAVTLHKPCGQITMNNAALAAGAVIAFSFVNNTVSVTDTVLFNVSGGTPDYGNYSVMGGVTPGAIGVYVKNLTVGSLSDALVINFAVIKGATT